VGASGFGTGGSQSSPGLFGSDNQVAVGWITDGVFFGHCAQNVNVPVGTFTSPGPLCRADAQQIQLTTTWTISGAYEHYWTPELKTAISAGYSEIHYNDQAKSLWANAVCRPPVGATQTVPDNTFTATTINAGFNSVGTSFCDPDWAFLQTGIRTQWAPSAGFYMGVDVGLVHVFTAFKGATAFLSNTNISGTSGAVTLTSPVSGARPAGFYTIKDLGTYYAIFRANRTFNAGD